MAGPAHFCVRSPSYYRRMKLKYLLLVLTLLLGRNLQAQLKHIAFEALDPALIQQLRQQRQRDTDYLATCVALEAVGEGRRGMEAVAEVIVRRSDVYGTSVVTQIMQRSQFASMNAVTIGGGAYARLRSKARRIAGKQWDTCLNVARAALDRTAPARAPGALFFYDYRRVSPKWRTGMREVAVIGGHRFMRPL